MKNIIRNSETIEILEELKELLMKEDVHLRQLEDDFFINNCIQLEIDRLNGNLKGGLK